MCLNLLSLQGSGPRVVVSTEAFHPRVRGSFPGRGGLKTNKNISSPSTRKTPYCGGLQGLNFESENSDSFHFFPYKSLILYFKRTLNVDSMLFHCWDNINSRYCVYWIIVPNRLFYCRQIASHEICHLYEDVNKIEKYVIINVSCFLL